MGVGGVTVAEGAQADGMVDGDMDITITIGTGPEDILTAVGDLDGIYQVENQRLSAHSMRPSNN